MSKNKPIGKRMKSLKSYQTQQKVLSDWSANWKQDQLKVITQLEAAARINDRGEVFHMIDQLKGLTEKRFTALNNVLYMLTDPDRKLIDERKNTKLEYKADTVTSTNTSVVESEQPETTLKENHTKHEFTLGRTPDVDIKEVKEIDLGEIVKAYNAGLSITELAKYNGFNHQKIVKILVTAGVYSSETYDKVKEMRESGKSDWEIMDRLNLSKKALNIYTPYKKGIYNLDNPTENALRVRKHRKHKGEPRT